MPQQIAHAVRRSRHVNGSREIVCRCGFAVTAADRKAQADFDAHVRLALVRGRISGLRGWLMKKIASTRIA